MSKFFVRMRRGRATVMLTVGHFLSHIKQQAPVALVDAAEEPAKHGQKTCFFARTSPGDLLCRPPLGQIGELGRLFTIVKQLIERDFQGAGHLFERLDGRDSVAIFDARDITAKKPGTLLDIALGEFFFLAQSAQTITDNHLRIVS